MAFEAFRKFDLFLNPLVSFGVALGDDLVTIRVFRTYGYPSGPRLWPLDPLLSGPCSHGPLKSPNVAIFLDRQAVALPSVHGLGVSSHGRFGWVIILGLSVRFRRLCVVCVLAAAFGCVSFYLW